MRTARLSRLGTSMATAGLVLLLPLAGTAAASGRTALGTPPTTTDPVKVGLFGAQDPTFDGVYRQSLALLALVAAGRTPPTSAVGWLLAQQCADGGFEAFRMSLSTPCDPPSSSSFSGEDTNSTGIAVQALHALGRGTEAGKALDWFGDKQSADGGWAYYPDGAVGNDPDANSTALGLSAYLALGQPVPHAGGPGGPTPYDALEGLQVGCEGTADEQGAFTFFGSANDYATVQATLAMGGGFLPVPAQSGADDAPVLTCPAVAPAAASPAGKPVAATTKPTATAAPTVTPTAAPSESSTEAPSAAASPTASSVTKPTATKTSPVHKPVHALSTTGLTPADAADAAAGYLVRRLAGSSHAIPDAFNPGQTDFGSTANAVLALVATGHGSSEVTAALAGLAGQVDPFVVKSGEDQPGALSLLILAAVAGGDDPTAFGGSNLVGRLAATVTVAAAPPASATPTPEPAAGGLADTGVDARVAVGGLLGALLLLAGAALLVYGRRGLHRA